MKLAGILMVAANLLLTTPTVVGAASHQKSRQETFGEWTVVCQYDDMEETSECFASTNTKYASQGLVHAEFSMTMDSKGLYLNVSASQPMPSWGKPIIKIDDNPILRDLSSFGDLENPIYDVNSQGFKYGFTLGDTADAQVAVGKRLRVRFPVTGSDLEAVIDLSGYSDAKAQLEKWVPVPPDKSALHAEPAGARTTPQKCEETGEILYNIAHDARDAGIPRDDVLKTNADEPTGTPTMKAIVRMAVLLVYDSPEISPDDFRKQAIESCHKGHPMLEIPQQTDK
jgi:hypothetical protein